MSIEDRPRAQRLGALAQTGDDGDDGVPRTTHGTCFANKAAPIT
jgi:hypothetical protein